MAALGTGMDLNGLPSHLADNPAFRAAQRHSRRVRIYRRAIPVLSLAAVAFLVMRSFSGFWGGVEAQVEAVGISGTKVVMEKPRLSGFKRDGRSYELTATSALQDLKTPNTVSLDTLNARMQTGNDGWADLAGAKGVYDSKIERLEVDGGVNVRTDGGLNATLKDARIEFKAGTITTDKPVEVTMPQGNVGAQRMELLDNGKRLVFEGRVRSVFVNPNAKGTVPEAEAQEPAAPEQKE
ncbi:MAG: LPS export ABC transporter periplasmic protein LptC [Proteobacteria bacterium]|nr:LPS export ABC transporter periplasmic protein LptC [Pseudomonadota bacterium]